MVSTAYFSLCYKLSFIEVYESVMAVRPVTRVKGP